jgi:hypothetical protein
MKEKNKKVLPISTLHPNITHLKGENEKAICNAQGATVFASDGASATCRSCNRKKGGKK